MSADDALLYIDANKYLDLYRTDKGKKLLGPLGEQVDHVFVTQQTVKEVQRNKILVAATFLTEKSKTLRLQTFNVPDHLSGTSEGQGKQILQGMSEIVGKIKGVNIEVDALATGILEQVSRSEDEVSLSLKPIFEKAVPQSEEELRRARERRELGNPPGKITNAIGDQLTWEQILSHFEGKKRLWIISRDGDYGTVYGGKAFINRLLLDELCAVTPDAEAFLFTDLVEGLTHFVETTGVKAEKQLTPAEAAEIELEEQSLLELPDSYPRVSLSDFAKMYQSAGEVPRAIADIAKMTQPFEDVHRAMAELAKLKQTGEEIRQAMANVAQPFEDVRRAMAEVAKVTQPGEEVRQTMAKMTQPFEDARRAMAELAKLKQTGEEIRQAMANVAQPFEDVRRAMAEMTKLAQPLDDFRWGMGELYGSMSVVPMNEEDLDQEPPQKADDV